MATKQSRICVNLDCFASLAMTAVDESPSPSFGITVFLRHIKPRFTDSN
jgi:hypothetical protein